MSLNSQLYSRSLSFFLITVPYHRVYYIYFLSLVIALISTSANPLSEMTSFMRPLVSSDRPHIVALFLMLDSFPLSVNFINILTYFQDKYGLNHLPLFNKY